ncbi:MAG TPA: tetratricopeptide repeat protein [Candidatus Dormibacteraeota bacterium]|nr:tetratricopeptide repeat protein [Candidatus Dormibacteraeota bacterium]
MSERGAPAPAPGGRRDEARSTVPFVLPLGADRPTNLPAHTSTFIGRETEVIDAVWRLVEDRLVTLVGPGGVGKTRLALRVADASTPGWVDGVWLVELAAVRDATDVARAVRAVLPAPPRRRRSQDVAGDIGERRMLLVLDNCEHVRDACAELVHDVLRRCPRVGVLATSRHALGVAGERVVPVEPFGIPADDVDNMVEIAGCDAVRLFAERGRFARPGFEPAPEVLPAVVEICRRLDGLPLAIELAAARLAVLSPAEILDQLDDRFRLLSDRGPVTADRHRTLAGCLEWGHDLLDAPEARLFARLGVFSGGFDLRAARAVCSGDGVAPEDVLDLLAALVAKSLVSVAGSGTPTRYRVLESVRCFAATKLAIGELDAVAERHARWYLRVAEAAVHERGGREPERWLDALEGDHGNLRAALTWARRAERPDVAMALGAALSWFWETRGHVAEGLQWLTWAIAHDRGSDVELRARALRAAGIFSWLRGDVSAAIPLVAESVGLFREAGNEHEATGCVCSGAFHMSADATHSLPALQDDLVQLREGTDHDRLSRSLVNCGIAYFFVSDARHARECFQECLDLPRAALDPEVVVDALDGLGRVAVMTGDLAAAEAAFGQALNIAQRIAYDDGCSTAWSWLGEICRIRGDYARARSFLAKATELAEDRRVPLWIARCQQFTARLAAAEGRLDDARRLFVASLEAPGTDQMPYHRIRSLQGLADITLAGSDASDAGALTEEAMGLARAIGDIQAQGQLLAALARLACTEADTQRAAKLAHEALQLQERIGDVLGIVGSLETLAEVAAASGRSAVAARLFGAAQQARETCGCRRPQVEAAALARHLPNVAALLDEGEWATAVRQGSTLSPAEAVSYATRGRGAKGRPPTGWDSLTRVELEIAGLVANGLSNPEIAERLMVSVKTVATHLSHVFRKLPVTDRRELRRMARERAQADADGMPQVG